MKKQSSSAERRRHTARTGVGLPQRIARQLRDELESGRYQAGDRFPSQNELAKTFRTSTVTSREAVASLVQDGLLERRFGSGTYVTGRRLERFVAVLSELDVAHPATNPSFLVTMQAARRRLDELGVKSRVYIGHSSPFCDGALQAITSWDFLHDLEAGRILGVILIATTPHLLHRALAGHEVPFVDGASMDGVRFWEGNEAVVRLGVKVLAEKGCRRVACMDVGVGRSPTDALSLFEQVVGRHGMSTRPEWLVAAPFAHEHGDGVAAFQQLWQSRVEKPDGLLVLDDVLYRDMGPALLANRIRVPEDLMVASLANVPDPRPVRPEPVKLALDVEALGRAFASNLVNRMKDPAARPVGIPIPLQVVEPESDAFESLVFAPSNGRRSATERRVLAGAGVAAIGGISLS